ncbi:hypothetical protein HS088_TW15G00107 [Tripterygium wilfordii]|uniref:Uncharacterized protein n=1 Tax=Tripterygium wilfordii TaxID=458696 RepID=A0A7J7CKL6_TRIWF|nr:hypothetical protein HS088_TW15G00107 [Tripterygium wilfordii]
MSHLEQYSCDQFRDSLVRRLLTSKIDFQQFLRHGHHQHRHKPTGSEVDPGYDVEKRLVPTGPNPLHH